MDAESAIWTGLAGLSALYWSWLAVGGLRWSRVAPPLGAEPPPERPLPGLSVVIPVRNEAAGLEAAARTLLGQEGVDLELLWVDDRSSDATPEVLERLRRADARVRVLRIEERPEGWLGKVHAMHRGLEAVHAPWVLFTDADVHFAPFALRNALTATLREEADHLLVMPEVRARGLLLQAALSAFGRGFLLSQRLWRIPDPTSDAAAGVGAFALVRREHLERSGGLEPLRLEVADDVALGRRLKRAGGRAAARSGRGSVHVVWYEHLWDLVRGLEKNSFAVAGCRLTPLALGSVLFVMLELGLFGALLAGHPLARALGGFGAAIVTAVAFGARRTAARPLLSTLLYPLGALLLAFISIRAGILGRWRGGIRWRESFHASEELRAHSRLRAWKRG